MRVIKIEVYTIEELSKEAKERALDDFNSDPNKEYIWMDDGLESLKKGLQHFDFKLLDWSIDYSSARNSHTRIGYESEAEEIKGEELKKHIEQNYLSHYNETFQKSYNILKGECPFTGYSGDEDFIDPLKKFLENPDKDVTFPKLMELCVVGVLELIEKDYEYQNSMEFFEQECEDNEVEFTSDGKQYKS